MVNTHKGPHELRGRAQLVYRRVQWPVLGLLIILLGGYTYFQISALTTTVGALSVALTAEQNATLEEGGKPVAPPAVDIVEDPEIIPGKPGDNGLDGRDGMDGEDGSPGKDGLPGRDGDNGDSIEGKPGSQGALGQAGLPGVDGVQGEPGKDGADGTNGKDGQDGADGVNGADGKDGQPPASWTWQMGSIEYTCSRAENFDPNNPKYTCSGTSIVLE